MGSYRSKEDDVTMISTSIYVTNFPESFSAKDLFQVCKQYGHVIDSFIPVKKSKEGKRFGFVRFINVFNVDRLVGNLCTIWVNRLKLQANLARFQREPLNNKKAAEKMNEPSRGTFMNSRKDDGGLYGRKSFVNVVMSNEKSDTGESSDNPSIVLDDECLNAKDLSNSLMGRVKEFTSLTNLKTALTNEGFLDIRIRYMGELWVMLEFDSSKSKDSFRVNVGVNSWFSKIKKTDVEFIPNGRIVWVEIEGIPFKFWSGNTFKRVIFRGKVFWVRAKEVLGWVPDLLKEFDDEDHSDSDDGYMEGEHKNQDNEKMGETSDTAEVSETIFDESIGPKENISEDPFGIYSLLNKKDKEINEGVVKMRFMKDVRGLWLKSGVNLLIVVVYGPYDSIDKRILWDYLGHTISQWDGEVIVMGDFNEVRYKTDRFGSVFNVHGANDFNTFIANAGLEEVPLGEIREWIRTNRNDRKGRCGKYKKELSMLDDEIDNGNGSEAVVNKRLEVLNELQSIDKLHAMDMAQKAKIKWAVEGDENSWFFHGMLNRKRHQQSIRGVMADGVWKDKPADVKLEFLRHFSNRFDKPSDVRATIDMHYPRFLDVEQHEDLERGVSKEEIKKAVWDCGTDKSPGPDGFTFDFYRHFWSAIENDVVEAVSMYKIIAKILTNRLVGVLGDIVSEVQSAFIAERQILDGPFILNEVVETGLFTGIKLNQSVILFHMFYADDAVFVGQWSDNNINTLVYVMDCFYRASGLHINMSKSKILRVNVEGEKVKQAAAKLGCLRLHCPFLYLGTKVGDLMTWVDAWKEVVDKDGGVDSTNISGVQTCWKSIINEIKSLKSQGVNVTDFMRLKLGNGNTTSFRNDNWHGDGAFKDLIPRLYALENSKEVKWSWSLESSGEFSVASIRRVIDKKRIVSNYSRTRWVKYVPIKVNVLAWKIKINALPTRLNISRRFRQIARKIAVWWNVNNAECNSYDEWVDWLASLRLGMKAKLLFVGTFYSLWWNIWTYRNKLLFDDKHPLKANLFDNVVSSSFIGVGIGVKFRLVGMSGLKTLTLL
nr:nucleotide-binding alpha-beta plait domain-containing protein [Tanacetum cinerariifolium]